MVIFFLTLKIGTHGPISLSSPELLISLPSFYFQQFGEASLWLSSNSGFYRCLLSHLRGFQGS